MKVILGSISFISMAFLMVTPAFAVSTPVYPDCANPQAAPDVQNDGIHGIVGNANTFTGNDKVYKLSANNTVEQCFCDTNGSGIQTNWLKATGFSESDIKVLESQGWVFVPDGSAWGLDASTYLAKNSTYACLNGTSTDQKNDPASSNSSGSSNNSNTNSSNTSSPAQQVLGAATNVLGLAFTGNTSFIVALLVSGLFCLIAAAFVKKAK